MQEKHSLLGPGTKWAVVGGGLPITDLGFGSWDNQQGLPDTWAQEAFLHSLSLTRELEARLSWARGFTMTMAHPTCSPAGLWSAMTTTTFTFSVTWFQSWRSSRL